MIHCITVPHSGTHLLMNALGIARDKWNDREVSHCHTYQPIRNVMKSQLSGAVISTLRHPRRIAESYRRRAEKDWNYPKFEDQMQCLIKDWAPIINLYLIVDHSDRDLHINQIQTLTGRATTQSWDVNKESGSVHGTHDIELDECPLVPNEFIDFYYRQLEAQGGS